MPQNYLGVQKLEMSKPKGACEDMTTESNVVSWMRFKNRKRTVEKKLKTSEKV